jgi:NAD(P)-dependent dehydrogenase (short-subunit alcohol dehydrogenase family)
MRRHRSVNAMLRKDAHLLVIGGVRGLGLELARTASEQGARVTVTGRDADFADARAAELGPSARGLGCELLDDDSLSRLCTDIDVVDHLVITAIERDRNSVADYRADAAARMMLIKTVGYANAVAHLLPKLDPDGSVVMFSGLSMWRPSPGSTTMSMANAAILGLVNSLAVEIAPVRVNAITPGSVAGTEAIDNADPVLAAFFEKQRQHTPAKRLPTPQDIIASVLFLLTCPSITGENLVVDAGAHLL